MHNLTHNLDEEGGDPKDEEEDRSDDSADDKKKKKKKKGKKKKEKLKVLNDFSTFGVLLGQYTVHRGQCKIFAR